MPYKITIEKIETVTVTRRGSYELLARVPWSDEDLAKRSETFYVSAQMEPMKEVRGYTPDREVPEEKSTKVYEQTVDGLDLSAVICAANNLKDVQQSAP